MTTEPGNTEFQVRRDDLTRHRIVEVTPGALGDDAVRLAVDRFSFTANNVTYGAAGDMLGYWNFFPAHDNADGGWGIIPVWAFADVVESNVDGIRLGERFYGYFPPASTLDIVPTRIGGGSVTDGSPHRANLPPLYNRYRRVSNDPTYDRAFDDALVLLAPLHMTSFCIAQQLARKEYYTAEQVVIVSASSKTSLGLAFALSQTDDAPEVIGLTSDRNLDFVAGVGLYDAAVAYGDVAGSLAQRRTVVVDMAGNAAVAAALRERLDDRLEYYINVGITHRDEVGSGLGVGGDPSRVEFFFAPSFILELVEDWGAAEYDRRSNEFLTASAMATFGWMQVDHRKGLAGLAEVYGDVCAGTISPAVGVVVTP